MKEVYILITSYKIYKNNVITNVSHEYSTRLSDRYRENINIHIFKFHTTFGVKNYF